MDKKSIYFFVLALATSSALVIFIVYKLFGGAGGIYHYWRFPYLAKKSTAIVTEIYEYEATYLKRIGKSNAKLVHVKGGYRFKVDFKYQITFRDSDINQLYEKKECEKLLGKKITIYYSDDLEKAIWVQKINPTRLDLILPAKIDLTTYFVFLLLAGLLIFGAGFSVVHIRDVIAKIIWNIKIDLMKRKFEDLTLEVTHLAVIPALCLLIYVFAIYLFKGLLTVELTGLFNTGFYFTLMITGLSFGPGWVVCGVYNIRTRPTTFIKIVRNLVSITLLFGVTRKLITLIQQLSIESSPQLIASFLESLFEAIKDILNI